MNQFVREGWKRRLLARRSKTDPSELRAYICYGSVDTTDKKFVEAAGSRGTAETCFKESKSETGLDQYEVRGYNGWRKHITFACAALALITVLSGNSLDTKRIQEHDPITSSLDAFKKKRDLRV
jgi:SRSO17 transposase